MSGGRTTGGRLSAWAQRLYAASIQRLLSVALVVVVSVLVFTGVTAAVSAVWTSCVSSTIRDAGRFEVANRDVRQDMNDAETGVQSLLLSGRRDALQPYEAATTWLPSDQQRLTALARDHEGLATVVEAQRRR